MHLRFLHDHFNIISINDIATLPGRNDLHVKGKPLCVLTFDDGWHDFYNHAFPILKTYGAKATVFLPTDFIGTEKWFWSDKLSYLLYQNKNAKQANNDIRCGTDSLGHILERAFTSDNANPDIIINRTKQYRQDEIENVLSSVSNKYNLALSPHGRAFLSWQEVKKLSDSGIITVGSHTATHRILTTLNKSEIQDELMISRKKLIHENLIERSLVPFCYPNGDYNSEVAALVKDSGYILAVTTEKGRNCLGNDIFTLKRIGMHEDVSRTESMFAYRIYGAL
jgi:peptidoglycan/xylan/chitin deacetylase (PgdA/CDA1 family)